MSRCNARVVTKSKDLYTTCAHGRTTTAKMINFANSALFCKPAWAMHGTQEHCEKTKQRNLRLFFYSPTKYKPSNYSCDGAFCYHNLTHTRMYFEIWGLMWVLWQEKYLLPVVSFQQVVVVIYLHIYCMYTMCDFHNFGLIFAGHCTSCLKG